MTFRILMLFLAVMQLLVTGIPTFACAFADGGQCWEASTGWQATVFLLDPLAAIVLLILVITSQPKRALIQAAAVMLFLNINANMLSSFLVVFGIVRDVWWWYAVFSVIPVIGLAYCLVLARNAT